MSIFVCGENVPTFLCCRGCLFIMKPFSRRFSLLQWMFVRDVYDGCLFVMTHYKSFFDVVDVLFILKTSGVSHLQSSERTLCS